MTFVQKKYRGHPNKWVQNTCSVFAMTCVFLKSWILIGSFNCSLVMYHRGFLFKHNEVTIDRFGTFWSAKFCASQLLRPWQSNFDSKWINDSFDWLDTFLNNIVDGLVQGFSTWFLKSIFWPCFHFWGCDLLS